VLKDVARYFWMAGIVTASLELIFLMINNKFLSEFIVMVWRMIAEDLGKMAVCYALIVIATITVLFPIERPDVEVPEALLEDGQRQAFTVVDVWLHRLYTLTLGSIGFWDDIPAYMAQFDDGVPSVFAAIVMASFIIIVVVMLFNMLVAMMAETFIAVGEGADLIWRHSMALYIWKVDLQMNRENRRKLMRETPTYLSHRENSGDYFEGLERSLLVRTHQRVIAKIGGACYSCLQLVCGRKRARRFKRRVKDSAVGRVARATGDVVEAVTVGVDRLGDGAQLVLTGEAVSGKDYDETKDRDLIGLPGQVAEKTSSVDTSQSTSRRGSPEISTTNPNPKPKKSKSDKSVLIELSDMEDNSDEDSQTTAKLPGSFSHCFTVIRLDGRPVGRMPVKK